MYVVLFLSYVYIVFVCLVAFPFRLGASRSTCAAGSDASLRFETLAIILCMYVYIYIYIYTYMADSPDQRQLKAQKCTQFACELNNTYPINRTNIGVA